MRKGILKVIYESDTGRNMMFENVGNHHKMTVTELVQKIESGNTVYSENYYVRKINGQKTPCSKPDGNTKNNLG